MISIEDDDDDTVYDAVAFMKALRIHSERLSDVVKTLQVKVESWRDAIAEFGKEEYYLKYKESHSLLMEAKHKLRTVMSRIKAHENLYHIVHEGYGLN